MNLPPILSVKRRQKRIRKKHIEKVFWRDLTIDDVAKLGGGSFYVVDDEVCSLFKDTAIDRIRYVCLNTSKAILGTRPCVTEAGQVEERVSQATYLRFQLTYNSAFGSAEYGSRSPQLRLENIEMPAILIGAISSHLLKRFVGDRSRIECAERSGPPAEGANRLPEPFQLRSGKDERAKGEPGAETGAPGHDLVPPIFHTGSTSTRTTICGRAA